jgi:hypothetical protein
MSANQPKTMPEILGLKTAMKTRVVNQPDNYPQIMNHWQFKNASKTKQIDFAHLFVRSQADLQYWLPVLKQQLKMNGMIWVSWIKKSSGIFTDVSENAIRDFGLSIGLVDVKVCAVSSIWSGLKLVIPIAKRL